MEIRHLDEDETFIKKWNQVDKLLFIRKMVEDSGLVVTQRTVFLLNLFTSKLPWGI